MKNMVLLRKEADTHLSINSLKKEDIHHRINVKL